MNWKTASNKELEVIAFDDLESRSSDVSIALDILLQRAQGKRDINRARIQMRRKEKIG